MPVKCRLATFEDAEIIRAIYNREVVGSTVTFDVHLQNFTLDPGDVGKRNKARRGHLHFQMDGGKFDYPRYSGPNGQLAKTLGIAGKYSPSIAPE